MYGGIMALSSATASVLASPTERELDAQTEAPATSAPPEGLELETDKAKTSPRSESVDGAATEDVPSTSDGVRRRKGGKRG